MRDGLPRARSFALSFAFVLVWIGGGAPAVMAGEPHEIAWRTNIEQARAEAVAQNKPIWIQFTATWCQFCRQMERETFPHPIVRAQTRDRIIPLIVHAESDDELLSRFGVAGLPATVFVAPSGTVLGKHEGFLDASEFLAFLDTHHPGRTDPATPALGGYCPVTLVERGVLKKGQAEVSLTHEGQTYRFADAKNRDRFRKEPERFIPCNSGRCVVSQVERKSAVAGDPRFGVYYRDRLFLCADEGSRRTFAQDPEKFAYVDVANDGFCPHCRTLAGRQVRGVPRYSAVHSGQRYYFPDRVHLEAFRADPDKFLR